VEPFREIHDAEPRTTATRHFEAGGKASIKSSSDGSRFLLPVHDPLQGSRAAMSSAVAGPGAGLIIQSLPSALVPA